MIILACVISCHQNLVQGFLEDKLVILLLIKYLNLNKEKMVS